MLAARVRPEGKSESRKVGKSENGASPDLPTFRPSDRPTQRLRSGSRALIALGALALLLLYVTPLWHVGLKAPQYPEGLGMYIWVNKITGEKPHDLNSINGLNHYIGM